MKYQLIIISYILLLISCIQSINPFCTVNIVVEKDEILGKWVEINNEKYIWTFEKANNIYNLRTNNPNNYECNFDIAIFELNNILFMNVFYHDDILFSIEPMLQFNYLNVHTLFKININDDKIELSFIDDNNLLEYLNEYGLKYIECNSIYNFLIIDESYNIADFLKKYSNNFSYTKYVTMIKVN